jgi:predicted Holliday junction resolvase-like endonuclease
MSEEDVKEVVIMDVKTGGANLNKVQRQIRDVIKAGKVTFRTFKPDLTVVTEV